MRDRLRLAERRAEDFSREADRGRQQVTELKEQLARAQAGAEDRGDAGGDGSSLRVDLERAREEARQLRDMLADAEERAQAAGEARA